MQLEAELIWVFHAEGARFSSAAFTNVEAADDWINKHSLTGILTAYPLNLGVYDWAIDKNLFSPKNESHVTSKFIGSFTSAYQEHFHYEAGVKLA